ncbi:Hydrolase, NUDIX family [Hoyosella subflava DQS3-9A1]|uniref:Hydrolase, NUDIX family n=2 Tax=Hoyosella TaxID=697025 RepID=F6EHG5_HOYSD|nr:Hydrolase, NUDIX family [Hoyosella subflava DQS3-9A1]
MDEVVQRVAAYQPRSLPPDGMRAATALVLCAEPEPLFVVIRRATRHGDPWSGHAALPGGRCDKSDVDAAATARRETHEEIGLIVGEPVGQLDDIGGRFHKGVVTPVVFQISRAQPLHPDPREVAAAHWVPLSLLEDPKRRTRHPHRKIGPWPAWDYQTGDVPPLDSLIIWGLTHRILSNFLDVIDPAR